MEIAQSSAIMPFIHNVGNLAIVTLIYASLMRRLQRSLMRPVILGILFSTGAVFGIMDPVQLSSGIIIDARHIYIALSALFASWPGLILTTAATVTARFLAGGAGALTGMIGILISAAAAAAFLFHFKRSRRKYEHSAILFLGIGCSLSVLSAVTLPRPMAINILTTAALPTALCIVVGTVAFGRLLARERARQMMSMKYAADARTDALTGLRNRRVFDDEAENAFTLAKRRGTPLSLVIIDIDHFKQINDVWGHAAGDLVLRRVSGLIVEKARKSDIVSRFGGEEITILMPLTDSRSATAGAERIRDAIDQSSFDIDGVTIRVTVSAGTAGFTHRMGNFSELLVAADKALYIAKAKGRNRVEEASFDAAA